MSRRGWWFDVNTIRSGRKEPRGVAQELRSAGAQIDVVARGPPGRLACGGEVVDDHVDPVNRRVAARIDFNDRSGYARNELSIRTLSVSSSFTWTRTRCRVWRSRRGSAWLDGVLPQRRWRGTTAAVDRRASQAQFNPCCSSSARGRIDATCARWCRRRR